jgi:hypothetical protein
MRIQRARRGCNNDMNFTCGEIGLVGKFRNESVPSSVLLPPPVGIDRSNLRALSVARSELVYTIQKLVSDHYNASDVVEHFVHTTTNAEKECNIDKCLASNENLQKRQY